MVTKDLDLESGTLDQPVVVTGHRDRAVFVAEQAVAYMELAELVGPLPVGHTEEDLLEAEHKAGMSQASAAGEYMARQVAQAIDKVDCIGAAERRTRWLDIVGDQALVTTCRIQGSPAAAGSLNSLHHILRMSKHGN